MDLRQTEKSSSGNKAAGPTIENVPKLLDVARGKMRMLHHAKRSEETYMGWIVDFLRFSLDQRGAWFHPRELSGESIEAYLTYLAVDRRVSAGTQNQALSALIFLYSKILDRPFRIDAVRAKKSQKLSDVLTPGEVKAVFQHLPAGSVALVCRLMYGAGLRLMEACRLRAKDIIFERKQIVVREGKGDKDRYVPLPDSLVVALQSQLQHVDRLHR